MRVSTYSATVRYRRPSGTDGVVICGGETIVAAIAAAYRSMAYYLEAGYDRVVLEKMTAVCADCAGAGDRQARNTRNTFRRVRCEGCGGRGMEEVPLDGHT